MDESFAKAWEAARNGAAFSPVPAPGLVSVRGEDRAGFLHGQLSADIKGLAPGTGVPAGLLSVHGKLVSPLAVYHLEGEHLLVGPAAAAPAAAAALAKMSVLADCAVEDLTGTRQAWLALGPRRAALLEALAGRPSDPGPDGARAIVTSAGTVLLLADFLAGPPAFLVLVPSGSAERLAGVLRGAADVAGAVEAPAALLEALRLEAGAPAWGVDADPDCLPQEVRMERSVKYDKGCYLGQEIMARLRDRGHVNRALVGLRLSEPASPGDPVEDSDGSVLGRLTSVAPSPTLGAPLALAMLKTAGGAPGAALTVRAGGRRVSAALVELPL